MALTGGMGSGKTTVARLWQVDGLPVVDTDELARRVVEPGEPALAEIGAVFGPRVIAPDGTLLRAALAELVFVDSEARRALEAIVHPRIEAEWRDCLTEWRKLGRPLGVVVIPLLFEKGLEVGFDRTICVACSEVTQLGRLARRGWSASEVRGRLAAQLSMVEKVQRADRVIWNEGSREVLAEQAWRVLLGI